MPALNILEKIVAYKKEEIRLRKQTVSEQQLLRQSGFDRTVLSMKKFLTDSDRTGIIAEFKKRSPSKGIINDWSTVENVTKGYADNGASVISVLTDGPSFGGSDKDLQSARFNQVPLLRKDFILDPYQLLESRAMGADVILLIAACLTKQSVRELAIEAHALGLEVLLEIHNEEELDFVCEEIDVVGINNRDLKTFTVDIDRSIRLSDRLPKNKLRIAESGIHDAATVLKMKKVGFDGFLIGEQFMKAEDPVLAFSTFVDQLKPVTL